MVRDDGSSELLAERTQPTIGQQEQVTAEYPAVESRAPEALLSTSEEQVIAAPEFESVNLVPLQTLQGFCSVRVVHTPTSIVVQEAFSDSRRNDIPPPLLTSLHHLARQSGFKSLGMVSREHLVLVHALAAYPDFICVLALEQSVGNFALAKVQIQRVFS